MKILIDADDVLEDLTPKWITYLNKKYGTDANFEEDYDWDLSKIFPTLSREQVYDAEFEEELWDTIEPIPGAVEYVEKLLNDGHELYIVTDTPYQIVKTKFEKVIFKYFPFLTWNNCIITSNKKMVKGDVLIDDGLHNLIGAEYRKILVSAPYNEAFDAEKNGMVRVKNWEEIYEAVSEMAREL